jgi:tRNA threonylcarbamoyl adenosine modification protein YeaZ
VRPVLALAGCGPRLEVALDVGGAEPPGVVLLAGRTPRSELVMAAVDLLFRASGLEPRELGAVVATRGPGSFTGIRVALATAQGLSTALQIDCFGISSLLVQASRAGVPCLAVQPARRGLVYVQPFAPTAGLPESQGPIETRPLASLVGSPLPVVGPAGLHLPPGAPVAATAASTVEALITCARLATPDGSWPAVPLYAEEPAAVAAARGA